MYHKNLRLIYKRIGKHMKNMSLYTFDKTSKNMSKNIMYLNLLFQKFLNRLILKSQQYKSYMTIFSEETSNLILLNNHSVSNLSKFHYITNVTYPLK